MEGAKVLLEKREKENESCGKRGKSEGERGKNGKGKGKLRLILGGTM